MPLFLAFLVWFWVRVYYLPVPALMLEPVGVLGAIGRGYHLTRGAFWRTFGIALLTVVIAQAAGRDARHAHQLPLPGGAARRPAQRGGGARDRPQPGARLGGDRRLRGPFTTAVASLQYLDLRMRTEGHDITLMQQAGVIGA